MTTDIAVPQDLWEGDTEGVITSWLEIGRASCRERVCEAV